MAGSFDEIGRFDDSRHPTTLHARRVRRRPRIRPGVSRRDFIRRASIAASSVGLLTVASLPTARRAWATHAEDDMAPTTGASMCDALGSWVDDDNCSGCNTALCGSSCGSSNWHKHDGTIFALRPNECDGPGGTGNWDGWKWKAGTCCPDHRQNQVWRCHDGWVLNGAGNDEKSVCKLKTNPGTVCS